MSMQTQSNLIEFQEQNSNSTHVLQLWRSRSICEGEFISVAYPQWEIVFARVAGKLNAVIRGAETVATKATVPADGSWLGIRFRSGVFIKGINYSLIRDSSVEIPIANTNHIWLNGQKWEIPTFENADNFIARLTRHGVLMLDPIVSSALKNETKANDNLRSRQRHFMQSTGLSRQAITKIERAQLAAIMLQNGCTIIDTIASTGFSDQPHLTRSLKKLIGVTPGQLLSLNNNIQLSFIPRPKHYIAP